MAPSPILSKNTAEKNSFNIVLAPDTTLWNRRSEQKLEDSSFKIEVYTDAQTYQTISATPKITGKYNDAAGDNRAIQTGPRLSRVGVKSGVPTAANQPFALRQIWINPDKDYIDMPQFFKKLEITIALPYYTKMAAIFMRNSITSPGILRDSPPGPTCWIGKSTRARTAAIRTGLPLHKRQMKMIIPSH